MATVKVYSPVDDFAGLVAGESFATGVASVDTTSVSALQYFRRHGYRIGDQTIAAPATPTVDSRDVSTVVVGTRLRDAAVDPKPVDYLPPTNAGKADPHGPLVVSPEIHGSGPSAIVPGDGADVPEVSEVIDVDATEAPAGNATKADWITYALAQGADPDEIGLLNRDDIRDLYTPEVSEVIDVDATEA